MTIRVPPLLPIRSTMTDAEYVAAVQSFLRSLPAFAEDLNYAGNLAALGVSTVATGTPVTIGLGDKTFPAEPGKAIRPGLWMRAAMAGDVTKAVIGPVKSYDIDTGDLVLTVDTVQGAGTSSDWSINPSLSPANVGKQSLSWAAQGMKPRDTNGATFGKLETATYGIQLPYLEFSATVVQYAQFGMRLPKSAGTTTFTFEPIWMHGSVAAVNNGVVWEMRALGLGNGDAVDAALGSFAAVTDNGGTANTIYFGAESAAFAAANLAGLDWVVFEIARLATDGADDLAQPARLIGVVVHMTTTAGTDA